MNVRPAARREIGRRGEVTTGLAAVAVLLALVVGLPVALWLAVGWPLPRVLPSFSELQVALARNQIPDETVVKSLAVLGWLAWGQFTACVLVELSAAARGRLPARVPLAGVSQALAGRLVAAVILLSSTGGGVARASVVAPAGIGTASAVAPVVVMVDARAPVLVSAVSGVAGAPAARPDVAEARPHVGEADEQRYVVQGKRPGRPRDTLWRIAEAHLGDPLRWRELWQLNRGRELPDGRQLDDPDWIYPGWELRMPADAVGLPPLHEPAAPEAQLRHQMDAAEQPPDEAPAAEAEPEQAQDQADAEAPAPEPAPAPAEHRSAAQPRSYAGAPVAQAPAAPEPGGGDVEWADGLTGLLLGTGGLLAAGVAVSLTRLRRVQQRRRRSGAWIGVPGPALARIELAVRAAQQPETAHFLDVALRALAAALRAEQRAVPDLLAVELANDRLDVLLATPAPAPTGWTLVPGERRWRLNDGAKLADLETAAAGTQAPVPALVTIGSTRHGVLMINPVHPGVSVLSGDLDPVRRTLDTLAVELATSIWADRFELALVGFGDTGLAVLDHVTTAETLDELLESIDPQTDDLSGPDASLDRRPTLVLCARAPSVEQLERLVVVSGDGEVAAIVPGEPIDAGWTIVVCDRGVEVDALGLRLQPSRLPIGQADAVGELLRIAAGQEPDTPGAVTPARPPAELPMAEGDDVGEPDELEAPPAEIRVLGPVELQLGSRLPEHDKARELIVHLALCPEGVDAHRLWAALWPGRPMHGGILHAVVAVARNALGDSPDGSPLLLRGSDERWRLHPAVRLDWARFWVLSGHARPGAEGIPVLRSALALVRGEPFQGTAVRSYGWAEVSFRPLMEAAIVDVAEDLAYRCLDAGNPAGAAWAARRGLAASPYDERLYRLLMLAADLAADPGSVTSAMDELQQRLEDGEIRPYDDLHEETQALYEQLGRSLRPLDGALH